MRICQDPRIPDVQTVQDPPLTLGWDPQRATEDHLMIASPNRWNIPLINSLFDPCSAASILKIPLSSKPHMDKWIWREEKRGNFSVRSAYHLIQSSSSLATGESSSSQALNPIWKAIWKMNIPHKIRLFAWRACKDGLPCFSNLARRGIRLDSSCAICHAPVEDLSHALFYYPDVREWWPSLLVFMGEISSLLNFIELVKWVKNRGTYEDLKTFFVIA